MSERGRTPEPFWVVGHRGSPEHEPENTLRSFARALAEGANALELDLSVTRDERVVLWHDADPLEWRARFRQLGLEPVVRFRPRVPSDKRFLRPASELSLDELRARFGYADARGVVAGSEIPTFDEFVEWARRDARLGLVFLDVKVPPDRGDLLGVLVRRVGELLQHHRPAFGVVYESASAETAKVLARLAPEHSHTLDIEPPGGLVIDWESCSAVRAAIAHGFSVATPQRPRGITLFPFSTHRRIVKDDLERMRCHNHERPHAPVRGTCAFTINHEHEMRELIELGVWAIQSDRPALLRRVALASGRTLARAS
jgi:glycerophosphoryl diester phosphodiesterase